MQNASGESYSYFKVERELRGGVLRSNIYCFLGDFMIIDFIKLLLFVFAFNLPEMANIINTTARAVVRPSLPASRIKWLPAEVRKIKLKHDGYGAEHGVGIPDVIVENIDEVTADSTRLVELACGDVGPVEELLGLSGVRVKPMSLWKHRVYGSKLETVMKLNRKTDSCKSGISHRVQRVKVFGAELYGASDKHNYLGGLCNFELGQDGAEAVRKRLEERGSVAMNNWYFQTNDWTNLVGRMGAALARYSQDGVLSWDLLSGGNNTISGRDNIIGRVEEGAHVIHIPEPSSGVSDASWYATVAAALGCGCSVTTDGNAYLRGGAVSFNQFSDKDLVTGLLDSLARIGAIMKEADRGALFSFSLAKGLHSEMTVVSHSDEGGIVRDIWRSAYGSVPCGCLLLGEGRLENLGVPSFVSQETVVRFVDSIMLYSAALSAVCDPLCESEDSHYPSIFTSGNVDEHLSAVPDKIKAIGESALAPDDLNPEGWSRARVRVNPDGTRAAPVRAGMVAPAAAESPTDVETGMDVEDEAQEGAAEETKDVEDDDEDDDDEEGVVEDWEDDESVGDDLEEPERAMTQEERWAMEHHSKMELAVKGWASNYAVGLERMFCFNHDERGCAQTAALIVTSFDSMDPRKKRHLGHKTVSPFFWIEPQNLLGREIADMPAQKQGYGVYAFVGESALHRTFEEGTLAHARHGDAYVDVEINYTAARRNIILNHLANRTGDGLAAIIPFQTREEGLFQVGGSDSGASFEERAANMDDMATYLWKKGSTTLVAPAESLQLKRGMKVRAVFQVKKGRYVIDLLKCSAEELVEGDVTASAMYPSYIGYRDRIKPFSRDVVRSNSAAADALASNRGIIKAAGSSAVPGGVSGSYFDAGESNLSEELVAPRRLQIANRETSLRFASWQERKADAAARGSMRLSEDEPEPAANARVYVSENTSRSDRMKEEIAKSDSLIAEQTEDLSRLVTERWLDKGYNSTRVYPAPRWVSQMSRSSADADMSYLARFGWVTLRYSSMEASSRLLQEVVGEHEGGYSVERLRARMRTDQGRVDLPDEVVDAMLLSALVSALLAGDTETASVYNMLELLLDGML